MCVRKGVHVVYTFTYTVGRSATAVKLKVNSQLEYPTVEPLHFLDVYMQLSWSQGSSEILAIKLTI